MYVRHYFSAFVGETRRIGDTCSSGKEELLSTAESVIETISALEQKLTQMKNEGTDQTDNISETKDELEAGSSTCLKESRCESNVDESACGQNCQCKGQDHSQQELSSTSKISKETLFSDISSVENECISLLGRLKLNHLILRVEKGTVHI